jgi:shikimate kinase
MNARCRDSVIQLLEDEALEQQLLMDLLDNTQKSLHKSISIPKLSSFKSIPTLNDIQEEEEEEEEEEAHKLLEKEFEGFGEPSDGSIIDTTFNLASSVPSRGLSSSSSSSSSRVCDVDFFKDIEVNLDDTLSLQASDDVVGV